MVRVTEILKCIGIDHFNDRCELHCNVIMSLLINRETHMSEHTCHCDRSRQRSLLKTKQLNICGCRADEHMKTPPDNILPYEALDKKP